MTAIPDSGIDRVARALRLPTGIMLAVLTGAWLAAVVRAPLDSVQGVIQ